jgi:hypothetical protein
MSKRKPTDHVSLPKSTESATHSIAPSTSVNKRARELALISGRDRHQVSTSDRILAKQEISNDDHANDPADDPEIIASGFGAPPTSHGSQMKNQLPDDDTNEERMVQGGVDEAEHDTMVRAVKNKKRDEV